MKSRAIRHKKPVTSGGAKRSFRMRRKSRGYIARRMSPPRASSSLVLTGMPHDLFEEIVARGDARSMRRLARFGPGMQSIIRSAISTRICTSPVPTGQLVAAVLSTEDPVLVREFAKKWPALREWIEASASDTRRRRSAAEYQRALDNNTNWSRRDMRRVVAQKHRMRRNAYEDRIRQAIIDYEINDPAYIRHSTYLVPSTESTRIYHEAERILNEARQRNPELVYRLEEEVGSSAHLIVDDADF